MESFQCVYHPREKICRVKKYYTQDEQLLYCVDCLLKENPNNKHAIISLEQFVEHVYEAFNNESDFKMPEDLELNAFARDENIKKVSDFINQQKKIVQDRFHTIEIDLMAMIQKAREDILHDLSSQLDVYMMNYRKFEEKIKMCFKVGEHEKVHIPKSDIYHELNECPTTYDLEHRVKQFLFELEEIDAMHSKNNLFNKQQDIIDGLRNYKISLEEAAINKPVPNLSKMHRFELGLTTFKKDFQIFIRNMRLVENKIEPISVKKLDSTIINGEHYSLLRHWCSLHFPVLSPRFISKVEGPNEVKFRELCNCALKLPNCLIFVRTNRYEILGCIRLQEKVFQDVQLRVMEFNLSAQKKSDFCPMEVVWKEGIWVLFPGLMLFENRESDSTAYIFNEMIKNGVTLKPKNYMGLCMQNLLEKQIGPDVTGKEYWDASIRGIDALELYELEL